MEQAVSLPTTALLQRNKPLTGSTEASWRQLSFHAVPLSRADPLIALVLFLEPQLARAEP